MIQAIVWDLDGTLLYTLEDLNGAVNAIMARHGYPLRTVAQTRIDVGNGSKRLIADSMGKDVNLPEVQQLLEEYMAYYSDHLFDKTRLYDGIMDLIMALKEKGIKNAVVSNKFDSATKEVINHYFPENTFDYVYGKRDGIAVKPAPDGLLLTLKEIGVDPCEAVYIGDSEVDYQTAANGNIKCISVSYGYRDKELLERYNPGNIVDSVEQLTKYLLENC